MFQMYDSSGAMLVLDSANPMKSLMNMCNNIGCGGVWQKTLILKVLSQIQEIPNLCRNTAC